MYLIGFPLLVLPFAFYNIVEFLMPGDRPGTLWLYGIKDVTLASGANWTLTAGDLMIAVSVLLLYAELIKATRPSSRAIIDHLLSTLLFIAMLMEFILFKQAATSTFFLMTVISFVDVVGGFSVTIRSAQRDINVDGSNTIQRV
jgi:hypothetical protein